MALISLLISRIAARASVTSAGLALENEFVEFLILLKGGFSVMHDGSTFLEAPQHYVCECDLADRKEHVAAAIDVIMARLNNSRDYLSDRFRAYLIDWSYELMAAT